MSDIKIFVSHRIDKKSETIENPLFINMRCGAIYDNDKIPRLDGDNVGDNISSKRNTFCELTIQYWAWKNAEADYYGLCHYRRYLSFSAERYQNVDKFGHIIEKYLNADSIAKHNLYEDKMRAFIKNYDIITLTPGRIMEGYVVMDSFRNNPQTFYMPGILRYFEIFREYYPDYAIDIDDYLNGSIWRAFNCFIMRKELFFEYNEMLFDLLFKLEKEIDVSKLNKEQQRIFGYMAECTFPIFYNHLLRTRSIKNTELQLIRFENTDKIPNPVPAFSKNNVAIALKSSNFYVPYLGVFLKSLLEHTSDNNNYDILIFNKEITNQHKKTLMRMVENYLNVSLRFLDPSPHIGNIKFPVNSPCYTEETYYSLLMPYILQNYNKLLVCDCDIVVQKDVAKLFEMPLDGFCLAAVKDTVYEGILNMSSKSDEAGSSWWYSKVILNMKNPYDYVNTGVLLLNLEKIRKVYTEEYILKIALKYEYRIQEQDILNALFEGNIKFLDVRWNYWVATNLQISTWLEHASGQGYREYMEAGTDPWLVHYANSPKPWNAPDLPYADLFWDVATRTPFMGTLIHRMTDSADLPSTETDPVVLPIPIKEANLKNKIKIKIIMPIVNILLPKGTKKRSTVRRWYYKLRCWEY